MFIQAYSLFQFWILVSENDSEVKHTSKSPGHKDQNDNISENQNKELWDGKKSQNGFQPLFSIKLYFGLEF